MGCKANDARKKVWDILEESNVPMNLKKLIANAVEKDYKEKAVRATEASKREAEADIVKAIEEVDDSKIVKEKTKGSLWIMRSKFDPDFGNPFLSKPSKDPKASDFVLPKATNKDLTLAFYNWLENSDNVPAGVNAKTREALNTKRDTIINSIDKVLNAESLVYNSTGANESINPAKVLILISNVVGEKSGSKSKEGSQSEKYTSHFNKGKATVKPKNGPDMLKAKLKAEESNSYIGYGKDGSSTKLYEDQLREQGIPINKGNYSKGDVVFASINGTPTKKDLDSTYNEVVKALESGAKVILDSKEYIEDSSYNKGEAQLAKLLQDNGYIRADSKTKVQISHKAKSGGYIVKNYSVGIWSKKQSSTGNKDTAKDIVKFTDMYTTLDGKGYIDSRISSIESSSDNEPRLVSRYYDILNKIKSPLLVPTKELLTAIADRPVDFYIDISNSLSIGDGNFMKKYKSDIEKVVPVKDFKKYVNYRAGGIADIGFNIPDNIEASAVLATSSKYTINDIEEILVDRTKTLEDNFNIWKGIEEVLNKSYSRWKDSGGTAKQVDTNTKDISKFIKSLPLDDNELYEIYDKEDTFGMDTYTLKKAIIHLIIYGGLEIDSPIDVSLEEMAKYKGTDLGEQIKDYMKSNLKGHGGHSLPKDDTNNLTIYISKLYGFDLQKVNRLAVHYEEDYSEITLNDVKDKTFKEVVEDANLDYTVHEIGQNLQPDSGVAAVLVKSGTKDIEDVRLASNISEISESIKDGYNKIVSTEFGTSTQKPKSIKTTSNRELTLESIKGKSVQGIVEEEGFEYFTQTEADRRLPSSTVITLANSDGEHISSFTPTLEEFKNLISRGYSTIKSTNDVHEIPFQHSSDLPSIKSNSKEFESIRSKLAKMYPEIKVEALDKIVDSEGIEVLGKALDRIVQYNTNKAKLDTLPHEYAHIYIDLLERTKFVKALIAKTMKTHNLSRYDAKEFIVTQMGENYIKQMNGEKLSKPIDKSLLTRLWKAIKEFFNKDASEVTKDIEEVSKRFYKGERSTTKSKVKAKSATNTGDSKGPTTRVELNSMRELDAYIDSIANNRSEATRAKQKLKFLSSIVPIDKLAVTVQDVLLYDGKNVDGLYHHGDGLIELSREGNLVNTLVHEIVHSLTERALQKSGLSDTVMKLEKLRIEAHTKSYTELGNKPSLIYGLSANQTLEELNNDTDETLIKSRVAEFVSELVANDELQDLLTKVLRENHKIPRKVGSLDVVVKLWGRLVNHLTEEDIESALSDGLTLVRALITEGVTTDGSTKKALIVRAKERSLNFDDIKDKLAKLYPEIKVEALNKVVSSEGVEVLSRIIDGIIQYSNGKAKLDTLPIEYANIYIKLFRDAPIVQEAVKQWGSEEKLVEAIGEQVVKQEGKVYGWWSKFSEWTSNLFEKLSTSKKEELSKVLTDAFLLNQNLHAISSRKRTYKQYRDLLANVQLRYKKAGIEVTSKEFAEYASTVFPDSELQDLYKHDTKLQESKLGLEGTKEFASIVETLQGNVTPFTSLAEDFGDEIAADYSLSKREYIQSIVDGTLEIDEDTEDWLEGLEKADILEKLTGNKDAELPTYSESIPAFSIRTGKPLQMNASEVRLNSGSMETYNDESIAILVKKTSSKGRYNKLIMDKNYVNSKLSDKLVRDLIVVTSMTSDDFDATYDILLDTMVPTIQKLLMADKIDNDTTLVDVFDEIINNQNTYPDTLDSLVMLDSKLLDRIKAKKSSITEDYNYFVESMVQESRKSIYREGFKRDKIGSQTGFNFRGEGFYFGELGQAAWGDSTYTYFVKLNGKLDDYKFGYIPDLNTGYSDFDTAEVKEEKTRAYLDNYTDRSKEAYVEDPSQVHIFGSANDVEMLKKWLDNSYAKMSIKDKAKEIAESC